VSPGFLLGVFVVLCLLGMVLVASLPERRGPAAIAWVCSAASVTLLAMAAEVLGSGRAVHISLWTVPPVGTLSLAVDRLSAVFVMVAAAVYLPVSIFSASYARRYLGHYSLRSFGILYHALFASIALVLVAADVFSFLLVWEAMAILSYLLVNYEHEDPERTRAGFLMLVMGEIGTLATVLAFLLLAAGGDLSFSSLRGAGTSVGETARWAVFLLSFFGFGVKAGLVPMSTWLPRAHPAAPANVSAILSGVILNLGIYGIARVNLDLLPVREAGAGLVVLGIGSLSALVGILYATTQNDLKTMLAHSSIENIGIVTTALGAGLMFSASGHAVLAGIAYIAALYHMFNHSVSKALLFLGAGTIDAHVGTRDMDALGGLIRRMPWTALCFLAGALSIAAMPPFNGFVSEWLTLQALLRSVELPNLMVRFVFAVSGAALALTAALAVTCFVKAFAMSFLGMPRSTAAASGRDAGLLATIPMGMLALGCLGLGVLPTYVIPMFDGAVASVTHVSAMDALVPPFFAPAVPGHALPPAFVADFRALGAQLGQYIAPGPGLVVMHRGGVSNPVVFAMSTSYTLPVLVLLLGVLYVAVRLATRARSMSRRTQWDGGLPRLDPEMTYTATGFSNPVRVVFSAAFHPASPEGTTEVVSEHFRTAIRRSRAETYIVDRVIVNPIAWCARRVANGLASMHHGRINGYLTYVLLTLVTLLALLLAGRLII
jgi:hydrogenase-4 component B